MKSEKLNLGCGEDYREGWVNVDVSEGVNPDRVVDLNETPWPFEDERFDIVEARHVLEHLDNVPWHEIVRIIKPGGHIIFIYPIGHTRFEDPTHEQFWGWYTAEQVGGERKHSHELGIDLRLLETGYDGRVNADPLTRLYARLRLLAQGPGPWLEQIPGFAGEREAVYVKPCR